MSEAFAYRGGALHAEDVPVERIAAEVGTPLYCYSAGAIEARYRRFAAATALLEPMICYAVKANSNQAVLRLLARLGAGADVVSEGELRRALAAGIAPGRIVFSGIGKTDAELRFVVERGIHQINVESLPELRALSQVATSLGKRMPIAIRVNPDVDARTHAKIATGKAENKFGIDLAHAVEAFREAASLPGIEPVGAAVHIGSQLVDLTPFRIAFGRLAELVRELRRHGIALSRLDLGGGIGVPRRGEAAADIEAYARIVGEATAGLGVRLAFEPGRYLVAEAGILVARVVHVKDGATRRFVILDAAMNDLIRPTLYDAWHDIVPVREPAGEARLSAVDVVGPVCETGDTLAVQRPLPPLADGDLVALLTAGAYGAVMSSTYNSRLLIPEVLVRGGEWSVVRQRSSFDQLLSLDTIPGWLGGPDRARGAA